MNAHTALPSTPRFALFALVCVVAFPLAAQTLAIKLVDPAGTAGLMNEQGDVVGSHMVRPCAVPFQCAPEYQLSVWTAAGRKALPPVGSPNVTASAISADGSVVSGTVNAFTSGARAVIWRLVNGAYEITELGTLGLQQSSTTGMDASGRIVGYATTPFVATRPFSWTAAGGMVDLAAAGAPAERIFSVSPGGRVLTDRFSFHLDNPTAATALPAPPTGGPAYLSTYGANFMANDNGDLAGFHITASSSPTAYYLHRYQAASSTWQLLATNGIASGSGLGVGVGRIDNQSTIGATVGRAVLAKGPAGLAVPLTDRISPAYPANSLASVEYFNDQGVFLGNVVIAGVARAAKLVPIQPCVGACLRVPSIQMTSRFVRSTARSNCGTPQCYEITAVVTVTDVGGNPMSNVRVDARFMDSYGLDRPVRGRTSTAGTIRFRQKGPAGIGTVSMIVESAALSGWRFDQGAGTLVAQVIALP